MCPGLYHGEARRLREPHGTRGQPLGFWFPCVSGHLGQTHTYRIPAGAQNRSAPSPRGSGAPRAVVVLCQSRSIASPPFLHGGHFPGQERTCGLPRPCLGSLAAPREELCFSTMLPWTPRATFPQLEGAVRSSSMARVAHVAHAGTPQHGHPPSRSSVTEGLRCWSHRLMFKFSQWFPSHY